MPGDNVLPKRSESHGGKCHVCGANRVRMRRMANLDLQAKCMACGGEIRMSVEVCGPDGCRAELRVREKEE